MGKSFALREKTLCLEFCQILCSVKIAPHSVTSDQGPDKSHYRTSGGVAEPIHLGLSKIALRQVFRKTSQATPQAIDRFNVVSGFPEVAGLAFDNGMIVESRCSWVLTDTIAPTQNHVSG
jgi:hypothetical protein